MQKKTLELLDSIPDIDTRISAGGQPRISTITAKVEGQSRTCTFKKWAKFKCMTEKEPISVDTIRSRYNGRGWSAEEAVYVLNSETRADYYKRIGKEGRRPQVKKEAISVAESMINSFIMGKV